MRSLEHATIGAVVGAVAVSVLARGRSSPAKLALWIYGLLLSVFIDLDHFPIARAKTGGWSHFTRAVRHPVWALTDQSKVFPDVEMALERLVSHVVIGGVLTVLVRPINRIVSTFSAAIICAHILADVLREVELA